MVLALMLALPLHAWGRFRFTPHMIERRAGLTMWRPAGLVCVAAALALLGPALRDAGGGPRRRVPLAVAG